MHNHRDELVKLDDLLDVRPNPTLVDARQSVGLHLHVDHFMSLKQIGDMHTEDDVIEAHNAEHAKGKIDHLHPETP